MWNVRHVSAANALNEYDIEFEVSAIEQSFALMF